MRFLGLSPARIVAGRKRLLPALSPTGPRAVGPFLVLDSFDQHSANEELHVNGPSLLTYVQRGALEQRVSRGSSAEWKEISAGEVIAVDCRGGSEIEQSAPASKADVAGLRAWLATAGGASGTFLGPVDMTLRLLVAGDDELAENVRVDLIAGSMDGISAMADGTGQDSEREFFLAEAALRKKYAFRVPVPAGVEIGVYAALGDFMLYSEGGGLTDVHPRFHGRLRPREGAGFELNLLEGQVVVLESTGCGSTGMVLLHDAEEGVEVSEVIIFGGSPGSCTRVGGSAVDQTDGRARNVRTATPRPVDPGGR